MIGALRGKVWRKSEAAAVIDCGGVGYQVALSTHSLAKLVVGADAVLEIYTHVREDQIALFGFIDELEKDTFELLLSVSGVGPKMALTILSGMPAAELVSALAGENLAVLTKISGVGKKTAERLVVELKGQVKQLGVIPASVAAAAPSAAQAKAGLRAELTSALANLGYKPTQIEPLAEALVRELPEAGFEALIREALARLRKP